MNRLTTRALSGAVLLALLACSDKTPEASAAGSGTTAAPSSAPPLRILRAHAFETGEAHQEALRARVAGCRLQQGLPPEGPVPMPPLAQLKMVETEELFDGPHHALYQTTTFLAPDPQRRCELVALTQRSVDIETSCGKALRGTTTLLANLAEAGGSEPFKVEIEEDPAQDGGGCQQRQAPEATTGAPVETLPGGARCVWQSAVVALTLDPKAAVKPGPDPTAADFCVHANFPTYPYSNAQGQGETVVLKSHSPKTKAGIQMLGLSSDLATEDLVSLTEGAGIPAARFSRADAESFLNQPHKRTFGAQTP